MTTSPRGWTGTDPIVVDARGRADRSRDYFRSQQFRQPSRSLRVPTSVPDTVLTRCRAIDLVSRDDAVLWGPTAAQLLGLPVPYRLEDCDVHVLVPEGRPRPRRRGVTSRQADIVPSEVVTIVGLRVTSPARTFADLSAVLGLADLVAVGDCAMRLYATPPDEFSRTVRRRLRYPGKVRARQAAALLTPLAESPQESRLRVHIIQAGLPQPEPNAIITDDAGRFLARGDLVYRAWLVVVEYDGAVHAVPEMRRRDAHRRTRLRENGWYVVEVVDEDLRDPRRAVEKVRRALRARGAI